MEQRDCGDIGRLSWGGGRGHHDVGCDHWGACDIHDRADDRHVRQNSRDKRRSDDGRPRYRVCGVHDHLVFGGNGGMDSGDLFGNRHATNGRCSGVLHHVVHRYGDGGSAHYGDGVDLHGYGGAECRGDGGEEWHASGDFRLYHNMHEDAPVHNKHAAVHGGEPLLHVHENLSASYSDGGVMG